MLRPVYRYASLKSEIAYPSFPALFMLIVSLAISAAAFFLENVS